MNGKELDLSKIAEMISKTAEIARDKLENQSDKMYSVGEDMISSIGEGALAGAKSAAKNIDAAGDIITTKYQNVLSEINRIGKKKGDISSLFATITQIKRSDLNSFNALKDELKDMKAIFTDVGEVKGLDAILKQYGKTADKLRSIDFGFGSAFVARGRAAGTKNLKVEIEDKKEVIEENKKLVQSENELVAVQNKTNHNKESSTKTTISDKQQQIDINDKLASSEKKVADAQKKLTDAPKSQSDNSKTIKSIDDLEKRYFSIIGTVEKYLQLVEKFNQVSGNSPRDLRKQVIDFANKMPQDVAGMLGERFVQQLANGFKGVSTKDIIKAITAPSNANAFGALQHKLDLAKSIDFNNIKYTDDGSIKLSDSDNSFEFLKSIKGQLPIVNELYEVLSNIAVAKKELGTSGTIEVIKQEAKATEQLAVAQEKAANAQAKYMYHAGKFRDNGRKAESLGSLYPGRSTGFYGTGTYGVDLSHIKEISTGQYGKRPMSIIDTSSYNLYNATNDKVASSLHLFLQQLTDKIYGSKGSKRINALYSDFNKLFPDNTIITTYDEFKRVVEEIATYVSQNKGRYPQMYDLDSAPTMFMKKLGYEGINTLGTRHADTTYGTVIYDLKEESIICKEITDELQKQQILEGNIGEVVALNSKKMQEVADSSKSQSEAISAENAELERQQKIVNSSADIKKFQDEWDKAAKNHAPEDMGQRYGYLMEAISGDSPTMSAVDALNELIAKEQEWKAEQEAALEASRKRVEEVQAFCAAATEYQETIFSSESVKGEYAKALESISSGSMSATEGMETLKAAIEKYNTEIVEAVPSTQQQSEAEQAGGKAATEAAEAHRDVAAAMEQEAVAAEKLASKQYDKMLNKKDMSSLLEESGANSLISFVPKSKQKGFRQDLIDFANASLNDDNGTMSDIYLKLTEMIDKYGVGKTSTDKTYAEVWDYLKHMMITIPEDMEKSFAAEFPDQWGQIKRKYGGNSKFKIKVGKGRLNVDQRYEELKRAFPGIFPDEIINDADQLRRIIEVADMGKAESKLPKFSTTPLSREDWGYIATVFSTMEEKAHALQVLYNDVDNSASEMAISSERTADAMERQAGASKNISDNLGESAEDENQVFPIGEGLNDQKALEMVSTSKKPTLSATVFDGITSNDQLQTAFQSIIKDVEQQSMTLVKSDILDSIDRNGVGTLKFVSDDMNNILVQTWKMVEGQLTLASEKYTSIFKEPELFDVEDRKKVAQAQAQTLRTQFKGFANDPNYSGIISGVETAAGNITDAASFKKFNVELTAAREALKQLKAEMSSSKSLDPLAAAEKTINKLPFTLEKIQVEYKSLKEFDTGDIFGAEGVNVESLMDAVKTGMNGFNDSTRSISDRLASFKDILKAFDQLSVLMSTLRTKSKESNDSFTPILNTYKELTKLQEEQKKAEVSGATYEKKKLISDGIVAKTEKLKQLGVDINDIDKNTNLTTEQRNKLLKAQEESLARIKKIEVDAANSQAQKEKRQSLNYGKGAFNSETRKKDNLSAIYSSIEDNYGASVGLTDAMNAYLEKYKQFETARQKIADPTTDVTKADRDAFNKAKIEVESARKALETYTTSYSKLEQAQNDGTLIGMDDTVDPSKLQNSTAALKAYGAEISNGKLNITGFNSTATEMYGTIDRGKGIIDQVTVALESSTGTLYAYKTATKEVGTAWEKFKGSLSRKTKELSAYIVGGGSIYGAINQIRKGITYVKEIDAALTELKKVTDETDETYNRFLQNTSKTAGQIGSTVKEFVNATADFARLGYNIEQASELAKAASVYYNVGDELDNIGEASDSIISTMHGFGIEASNAMEIVDKFNEVGNNFAISSSGIGQALLRSASAMAEAGNTIDESIGLITAANSVVQNPETVGTAMKTLSLRIRGAKVELEDAGEDVDGMASSVSELQKKLLALTGGKVNIMLDENTFKNTTEILREMSAVWDDMTDVNRASALELLGGKRQANVLAAVIKNFDMVEDAIKTSSDAAGSAEAENEKYLNSIQGKIDQFNNAVQTMWMNFVNTDATKFIIDLGTKFVQLIDKVGVLQSALIALAAIKILPQLAKGLGLTNLISDIFNLTNGLKDFAVGQKAANAATLSTAIATSLSQSSLVKLAIQLGITTAEEVASASATTLLGFSFKALGLSILGAAKAVITFLATNPIGWAILATTAIISLVAIMGDLIKTHDDYVEELKNTNEKIENLRSNIESLNSELETTKNRIEELESKGPLTITEQEELDKLKEQNAELERQIQLEKAREERARNKQAKAAQKAFETDDDFKVQPSNRFTVSKVTNTFEQKLGAIEIAKEKLDKAEIELQDALNSGMDTNSNKFKKLEKNLESAQEDYTDAQSNWDEFIKSKEDEYGDLEWFDGDNLTEAQKTVNEIISSMQNYNDRAEIMFGSAGAKESALNRLFGERGSEAGQAFQEAFNAKIESGEINVEVDRFGDYSAAIENVTGSVEELISKNPQFKVQLDSLGISAEDVARYFLNISSAMQQTNKTTSVAITDIASLTSAYDSYASALQIVNDTIFDGQAISDDYYNSLKEYLGDVTVGEESFSDAVDTTNGKVIKNTRLLRNLIAQKKKEQKATTSAARAQSQLQYTKIVKQLQQAVKAMYLDYKAYGYVTKATYDNINALRSQVQAIKNAIREYAILELKLSDVTNAYDEFEDAKNRDAELAYGDSMIEMLQAISDGFLSGQVGSEAFRAACTALVPESVIADCKTFEERLDAIDDYFENSKFADYFTIDEDGSFSIGMKNIEAFVADAKEAGAFISNADGTFTLDNSIQSVDDLANAMGLTKAATVAMLTELSKYDASWGDIVSDITMTKLDKGIRDTTDALDKAIAKQEQFFKEGKDPSGANADEYNAIQQEINNCSDALNNAQQAVVNNTKAWIEANSNVDAAKEKVATLTRELQELQEAGATDNEIQIKTNELEKAKEQLSEALSIKYGLEEPTQMGFQLVLTDVQSQIDKWKEENAILVTEVVPKLAQDKDGVWKIPAELELDEDKQQKIQEYVDLKNSEQQLELLTAQEIDPITDGITQVKEVLDNILKAITSSDSNTGTSKKSSSTTTTATSTSDTTGFESGSVDQDIAAWNAMVDEWVENINQFVSKFGEDISKFFTETLPEQWNNFWSVVGEKLGQVGEWAQEVGAEIGIFFTETLPQKWSEFWEGVGEWLDNVKTWAVGAGEDIGKFFTEILPEKWSEFWGQVGEFITEIPYNVSYLITRVKIFFTETLPEKWDEFWDNVGEVLNSLKEKAIALKDKVVEFFKVTIPQKWDEFWDAVGDGLNTLKENAIALKDKVVEFFTETIPEEWNAFWDSVGDYINEVIIPALSFTWDKVYEFFTTTVPEKWSEFWTSVGTYIEEVIKPALSLVWDKVHDFFMVTIPEKWNEFWTGVGDFITETVPEAFEAIKSGVSTFFTETVPEAINGLWKSVASWIEEKASALWGFLKGEWIRGKEDAEKGEYSPQKGASRALGNALAKGNAHSKKNSGLNTKEHNAVVGELGRELVVDPNRGIYYTVGENGTQMLDLPKGAIIYNHKQTEELLKNGETSRGTYTGGLSFAKGNAYWDYDLHPKKTGTGAKAAWGNSSDKDWSQMGWDLSSAADSISDAAGSLKDAADDTEQTIDFIEYRLEEIENAITHMTNRVENFLDDTSQIGKKNSLYEDLVGAEKQKASTYFAAAELYNKRAAQLLSKVPAKYQEMAKNGAIAIKDFVGESQGEIADAIEEYRTWSTKAEDAENDYLASIAEISAKRLEQLQDIADDFENIVGLTERQSGILQGEMDLLEESGERLSENFYKELMKDSQKQISDLNKKRASLQDILNQAVKSGDVQVGSDDWYEMVNTIYDVDDAILECKKDIEGFQNSINDLYWDNLDKLIDKIDNVDSELSHLYNLVSDEEKVVDEFGNWTKDGVTALGLLAQQLEVANFKVDQYGEAIARLEKDYAAGLYSTDEYNEKLAELKENQWDAIEAQESAKKSIIDLNKTRIQAVKDGMQKEIDAYSELIDKKKEELSLQKEAHDFSKQVAEQQKNIADIEKRLAVIAGDNSASAIAQKKKLQAELAQAKEELDELYYGHSIDKQQEALDKQLEDYQNNKQDEMDALDESLKNENQIIQDSYATVAANTELLAQNLSDIASKYGITLSDSVTKPWLDGANAIGTYQDQLDTSTSSFTDQLKLIKQELVDLQVEADNTANSIINATNRKKDKTESAKYTPPKPSPQKDSPKAPKPKTPSPPSKGSSVTIKKSAKNFSRNGGNGTRMQSWVPGSTFTVYQVSGSEVLIGRSGGYTGWVKLSDIEGYASGAKSINKDQFAFLDELGEELQLVPDGAGRLSYVKKGTGIIPADLTERLMEWGQLDPSSVLEQSRPTVSAPHVINNNIELNMQVGEVVHIDRADNSSIPNITKAVQDQMDNYMKNINKKLYNRVR